MRYSGEITQVLINNHSTTSPEKHIAYIRSKTAQSSWVLQCLQKRDGSCRILPNGCRVSVNLTQMPFEVAARGKNNTVGSLSYCSTFLCSEKSWKPCFCGGFSCQEKGLERTFILQSTAAGEAVQGEPALPRSECSRWDCSLRLNHPKATPSSKPQLFWTMWNSGRFSSLRDHAHCPNNFQRCCTHCQDIIHPSKQFPASDIIWFSTQNTKWGQDSTQKLMYNPGLIVCWEPVLRSGVNREYWCCGWNEMLSPPPFNHSPQCQPSLSSAWHELKS